MEIATASGVDSRNHLIGMVIAREISKHIFSKLEKLDSGRTTSPDVASPTSQPTEVINPRKRNAATEQATMPTQCFLNPVRGVTDNKLPNTWISDRGEPPLMFDLSVGEPAGSGSMHCRAGD